MNLNFDKSDGVKLAQRIFAVRFNNFGMRGDLCLWVMMKERLVAQGVSNNLDEFKNQVQETFKVLTGEKLFSFGDSVTLKRECTANHYHGGMSHGCVSLAFWREEAYPTLIKRHKQITVLQNGGSYIPVDNLKPKELSDLVYDLMIESGDVEKGKARELKTFFYGYVSALGELRDGGHLGLEEFCLEKHLGLREVMALAEDERISRERREYLTDYLKTLGVFEQKTATISQLVSTSQLAEHQENEISILCGLNSI